MNIKATIFIMSLVSTVIFSASQIEPMSEDMNHILPLWEVPASRPKPLLNEDGISRLRIKTLVRAVLPDRGQGIEIKLSRTEWNDSSVLLAMTSARKNELFGFIEYVKGQSLQIKDVYVSPKYFGKGVAASLLRVMELTDMQSSSSVVAEIIHGDYQAFRGALSIEGAKPATVEKSDIAKAAESTPLAKLFALLGWEINPESVEHTVGTKTRWQFRRSENAMRMIGSVK